jgi:NCAIR mutase (PurE)-related protein
MRNLLPHQHTVLCTRVEENVFHKIKEELPECEYNSRGRTVSLRSSQSSRKPERLPGTVAIISGSSPDLRVAEECRIVCEHLGCYVYQLKDLKMSNLPHVLSFLPAIKAADVVIVVSGLDGALPSLLSGLVESPVIAVPTSAGQGATLSGVAPMLASICSSTPVSVVNIDDGKTGAMCAMRILRQSLKLHNKRVAATSPQATVQV